MVDTGSERTLIRRSAVDTIEGEINHRKNPPNLQGVTGDPLRILGMTWTEIGIGDKKVSKQYLPVVPNSYLGTDLLLGCDILGQATITWCHPKQLFVWEDTPYVVNFVRKHRWQVEKVKVISPLPHESGKEQKILRVKTKVILPPYQSMIKLVHLEEEPGTNAIVYPEARVSHWNYPCYVTVTDERQNPCPVTNASKARKTFKVGTYLGSYEKAEEVTEKVNIIIQNDLLPHADQPGIEGDREGKIWELLTKQDWNHLTEKDREDLFTLITKHNEAFILEKGELGKNAGSSSSY